MLVMYHFTIAMVLLCIIQVLDLQKKIATTTSPGPFKMPTSRHFENRRGEGPGDEVEDCRAHEYK